MQELKKNSKMRPLRPVSETSMARFLADISGSHCACFCARGHGALSISSSSCRYACIIIRKRCLANKENSGPPTYCPQSYALTTREMVYHFTAVLTCVSCVRALARDPTTAATTLPLAWRGEPGRRKVNIGKEHSRPRMESTSRRNGERNKNDRYVTTIWECDQDCNVHRLGKQLML